MCYQCYTIQHMFPQVCHVYAIIKEERLKVSETVCSNGRREGIVYTSIGNMVEVRLVVRANDVPKDNSFMLRYEGNKYDATIVMIMVLRKKYLWSYKRNN